MSRPSDDLPERLLASDATDFERRVLQAAGQRKPSSASSKRMAKALGVTAAVIGTTATSTAAAGASAVWPWVSAGVIGLVVAGAIVGTRVARPTHEPRAVPPAATAPVPAPPESPAPAQAPAAPAPPAPGATAPGPRVRAVAAAGDLGEQVALIDSARAAMSAGAGGRALEILRRYQEKYPAGSFRPEAIAIKVEALMKVGRQTEARALAERFVAEHRGSLLARRVAEVAGLAAP